MKSAGKDVPVRHQVFSLTKRGNVDEEYEDAFAGDSATGRFAIADGATESSFAGSWARILVREFVTHSGCESLPWATWLLPLRRRWLTKVGKLSLPWYAEMKLEQGAFATFLGVVFETDAPERGRWSAVAIGDSCLFQVRKDGHLAFPVTRSEDFDSFPWLIGSREATGETESEKETRTTGDWQAGDRFYLMTDALAQWYLWQQELGQEPWDAVERVLARPDAKDGFAEWIDELRHAGGLRNDDVTLAAITLEK